MKHLLLAISFIITLNMKVFGQIERQIRSFMEIPTELLSQMEKMGVDSSLLLNEYEGRYLNFIFKVNYPDFDIAGKRVSFSRSKMNFFKDEKERFYRKSTPVGGAVLYIFNTAQKEETGGYDAAIVYWSKRLVPIEDVVKRLKAVR